MSTAPGCPDCRCDAVVATGPLPAIRRFAGRRLERPLAGGVLYRCPRCALRFRYPRIDEATSDGLYDNDEISAWTTALRTDQQLARGWLEREPGRGAVLDFGCYSGQFLGSLPPAFERFGVEINRRAADQARSAAGAMVWSSLTAIDPTRRFDAIVCMDVIEHVGAPTRLVAALLDRLRPGGLLLITTGDAETPLWQRYGSRWWYASYGEHTAFISRSWLEHHRTRWDAELVHCSTFDYRPEASFIRPLRFGLLAAARLGSAVAAVTSRPGGRAIGPARSALPTAGLDADHLFAVLRKSAEPTS